MLGGLKTSGNIWVSPLLNGGIQSNCHLPSWWLLWVCAGPGFLVKFDVLSHVIVKHTVPGTTGAQLWSRRELQGPSCVTDCVFSYPIQPPSKLLQTTDVCARCGLLWVSSWLKSTVPIILQVAVWYFLPCLQLFLQVVPCLLAWTFVLSLLAISADSWFPCQCLVMCDPGQTRRTRAGSWSGQSEKLTTYCACAPYVRKSVSLDSEGKVGTQWGSPLGLRVEGKAGNMALWDLLP